jgi:hypothetical protein
MLPTLTEILTVEIAEIGLYKVIAGRDIQSMLGFERQKDVLGCTDAACLAEIGGALGVDRIVASQVGMVGSTYVVNIKLINIRQADTEGRVYETVRGEVDALISIVKKSVQKLLGPGSKAALARSGANGGARPLAVTPPPEPLAPTPPPVVTPPPAPSRELALAPPPTAVETSAPSGGRKIGVAPWVFWGVGGAGLVAAAVIGSAAKSDANSSWDVSHPGGQVLADNASKKAKTATILGIVGGVSVASGFGWWWLFGSTAPATAFAPVVLPGGAGLAAVTSF